MRPSWQQRVRRIVASSHRRTKHDETGSAHTGGGSHAQLCFAACALVRLRVRSNESGFKALAADNLRLPPRIYVYGESVGSQFYSELRKLPATNGRSGAARRWDGLHTYPHIR